ncbi:MAG: ABC transporter ATP-binding protein [Oscillospiraceae bacterium]|nr:ABC transporter ATP-binding protein [Oscillospiraceae bacterium]
MNGKIEVKNICKVFKQGDNEVYALNDVSFSVAAGEFAVITGYSGSGKSTLLNILGALLTADSGSVMVDGRDICRFNEKQRNRYRQKDISIIFQSYNLLSDLTVYENALLGKKLGKSDANIEEILDLLDIGKRSDHYPSQLSGGEQQRASIARALCKGGDIYLCDEPTGALDVENGIKVLEFLQNLAHESGKTVITITHNGLVSKAADHNIIMRDGKVIEDSYNPDPIPVREVQW